MQHPEHPTDCVLCREVARALEIIARDELKDPKAHAGVKAEIVRALSDHQRSPVDHPDFDSWRDDAAALVRKVSDDIADGQYHEFVRQQIAMHEGAPPPPLPLPDALPFRTWIERVDRATFGNIAGGVHHSALLLSNLSHELAPQDKPAFNLAATHWALAAGFQSIGRMAREASKENSK